MTTRVDLSSCRLLTLLLFLLTSSKTKALNKNTSVPAVFVFGDSTVDPGNNNYLPSAIFKSNFPPYGRDYPHQIPTGRFTDGKLVTDFIISYAGIKDVVPAYLDPTLSEGDLLTGVSFASAGTGYDPFTAQISGVISMPEQLDYFNEYIGKLQQLIGNERAEDLVRRAVYVISCGTNDFAVNYFTIPIQRKKYSVEQYKQFLLTKSGEFLQGLRSLGARKVAFVGLPPVGCLPAILTINPTDKYQNHDCIGSFNSVVWDYNQMLQQYLELLAKSVGNGGKVTYVNIYRPLADMINSPDKFGFKESRVGCCGTGLIEAGYFCNHNTVVCEDASKYVFWDSIHPTERAYYLIFQSLSGVIDSVLH